MTRVTAVPIGATVVTLAGEQHEGAGAGAGIGIGAA
jgi:hypothetical protein